jgi:hypothetical protein
VYIRRYRPGRVPDGAGGWEMGLEDSIGFWGWLEAHRAEAELVFFGRPDLEVEDILEVGGEYYRLVAFVSLPDTHRRRARLEKVEKPLT